MSRASSTTTAACLDESTAFAFVKGQALTAPAREAMERHIDGCASCRQTIAEAARVLHNLSSSPLDSDDTGGAPLLPGTRIARYVLQRTIGSGRGGFVYEAHDPELRRRVAVKVLAEDSHLVREAQAMARLAHPNVVRVFDAGAFSGRVFIVMELVDGETLTDWLRRQRRTVRQVLKMFAAAGRGLAAAHAAGIVHRDFKPDNVLVTEDGTVQVSDFGLARPVIDATAAPDRAGAKRPPAQMATGTPAFMAPEQLANTVVDARADQFSFCVALSWALRGRHPFDPKAVGPPVPVGRAPRRVDRAVSRGLSQDASARFPAMAPLLAELGAADRTRNRAAILAAAAVLATAGLWVTHQKRQAELALGALETCDGRGPGGPPSDSRASACFSMFSSPLDWQGAVSACGAMGATLATCDSEPACDELAAHAPSGVPSWIGLSDRARPGTFEWASGIAAMTYLFEERWAPGEPPSPPSGPTCVTIGDPSGAASATDPRRSWRARDCADQHPYVCQQSPWIVALATRHHYRRLPTAMSWNEAVAGCAAIGAHLVTINDEREQAFVSEYFIVSTHFVPATDLWLGASDHKDLGHFQWISGEPFRYGAFNPGEPNNTGGHQECLILNSISRRWHDRPCELRYLPLCEREPD